MEWLWLKMLGSLLLIVGLIVATLWILKRFMTFGKPASASGIAMDIAGVLHLAPRRSVYAVKTGGQVILLGVAEHGGITFLTQFPEASFTSSAAGAAQIQNPGAAAGGIPPFFSMLLERFKTGNVPAFQAAPEAAAMADTLGHEAYEPESALPYEPAPEPAAPVVKKKRTSAAASRKKASNQ